MIHCLELDFHDIKHLLVIQKCGTFEEPALNKGNIINYQFQVYFKLRLMDEVKISAGNLQAL